MVPETPRECPREFPTMVFQEPFYERLSAQLTLLAGATKAYIDDLGGAMASLLLKVERVEESLRGDTAALRDQAGKVIQDTQETTTQVIRRVTLDQQAARQRIDEVTVSAERKFSDLGLLVAQTWSGVDGVANFAQQLEAQQAQLALCSQRLESQQAQLHQQQQRLEQHQLRLEQHLHAQQAQTA